MSNSFCGQPYSTEPADDDTVSQNTATAFLVSCVVYTLLGWVLLCTHCDTKLMGIKVVFKLHSTTCKISKMKISMNVQKRIIFQDLKHPAQCAFHWFKVVVGFVGFASRSSDSSSCGGIADKDGADQTANNNAVSPPRETTPLAEYENKLSRCFRWCDRFQNGW